MRVDATINEVLLKIPIIRAGAPNGRGIYRGYNTRSGGRTPFWNARTRSA